MGSVACKQFGPGSQQAIRDALATIPGQGDDANDDDAVSNGGSADDLDDQEAQNESGEDDSASSDGSTDGPRFPKVARLRMNLTVFSKVHNVRSTPRCCPTGFS